MSEQSKQQQGSEQQDTLLAAQLPGNRAWHLDGLQQRKMRQLQRRAKSPFRFPAWWIGLMLFIVMAASAAIAFVIFSLRAQESSVAAEPVIRVTTIAEWDASLDAQAPGAPPESASAGIQIIIAAQTPESLHIEGPVLPTVVITLTPVPLTIGASIEVAGVGDQELNIRNLPGLIDSAILFRAPQGASFDVIGGPRQADGFTWWQIRDTSLQLEGWAAANYLQVRQ